MTMYTVPIRDTHDPWICSKWFGEGDFSLVTKQMYLMYMDLYV